MSKHLNLIKYIFVKLLTLIFFVFGTIFIVFAVYFYLVGDSKPHHLTLGQTVVWQDFSIHGNSCYTCFRFDELGYFDSFLIQYGRFLRHFFIEGAIYFPFQWGALEFETFTPQILNTLLLFTITVLISLTAAFPLGILAAIKKNTWIDQFIKFIIYIGKSTPVFLLALLVIMLFSSNLIPGFNIYFVNPSVWLPAMVLSFGIGTAIAQEVRHLMLEIIKQGYMQGARARGITYGKVICRHIIHNIFILIIPAFKAQLGNFITGIILVEVIFRWNGLGLLLLQSILGGHLSHTISMIFGSIIILILLSAVFNFIIDVTNAFIDPQIRFEAKSELPA
ncbi:MAG: ABC transporter permease [Defluviitaleaceae bacterium]|nr:ABC transporter permease [Defluviitaleaceae bacterium]